MFCTSHVCQLLSLSIWYEQNILLIKLRTWWHVTMLHLTYDRLVFYLSVVCFVFVRTYVCSKWPCHLVVLQPQVFLIMGCAHTNFTIKSYNKVTFTKDEAKDLWQAVELIAGRSRLEWSLQPEWSGLCRPLCFLFYSRSPNQNLSAYENTVRTHRP